MTFFRRRREERLFEAVEKDDDVAARDLLKHGGLEWRDPEWHYSTPLHMCGRSNAWKCLKVLVRAKADLDALDQEGQTVFQLATEHQSSDVVDFIQRQRLEHPIEEELFELARQKKFGYMRKLFNKEVPPDVNSRHTKTKITALHIAAERDAETCTMLLLEKKADSNSRDIFGNTPLHYAVKHGNNDIVAQLLAAKAALDAANKWEQTPLHTAAEFNNLEAARQLLRVGAPRELRNVDGMTPLEFAKKFKATDVHALILNKDNREVEQEKLFAVCKSGDLLALRRMIAGGAELDCVDAQTGSTLLHEAAGSGQILCVMELIKAGLKYPIDVTDKKGWTPLHKTAIWNCPEEAEYLLDHKATVDSMDRKFQTPLHHACQHNSGDMVFLLLDSNANMYAQNKKGRTPGDLAKKYKQSDAYKVILQAQGVLPLDEDVDT